MNPPKLLKNLSMPAPEGPAEVETWALLSKYQIIETENILMVAKLTDVRGREGGVMKR